MKSRKNDSFFNRKEIDEENLTPMLESQGEFLIIQELKKTGRNTRTQ